jgi:hypothetical protein
MRPAGAVATSVCDIKGQTVETGSKAARKGFATELRPENPTANGSSEDRGVRTPPGVELNFSAAALSVVLFSEMELETEPFQR